MNVLKILTYIFFNKKKQFWTISQNRQTLLGKTKQCLKIYLPFLFDPALLPVVTGRTPNNFLSFCFVFLEILTGKFLHSIRYINCLFTRKIQLNRLINEELKTFCCYSNKKSYYYSPPPFFVGRILRDDVIDFPKKIIHGRKWLSSKIFFLNFVSGCPFPVSDKSYFEIP